VRWNFEKFLVSPNGKPVKRYDASTNPIDIEADIVKLLNQNCCNITQQLHH
jgi:glutathione peroxidase